MEDDILNTIEVLAARVKAKEDESNKLKKLVNELCGEAGIPLRYEAIADSAGVARLRSDQFYGLPLTAAIRNYLELRKAGGLGAATVPEIYKAVRDGGYKFDTKNEENARIGVGNALRKTSSIFHRLPNGQYGLLGWYPSARASVNTNGAATKKGAARRVVKKKKPGEKKTAPQQAAGSDAVTNNEIREMVLAQTGDFQGADIEKALRAKYPTKRIPPAKVATVIFLLKKKQLVKVVAERSGKKGATFAKA